MFDNEEDEKYQMNFLPCTFQAYLRNRPAKIQKISSYKFNSIT